ncbi:hypothetical protein E1A91_A03G107700v1 [Gossypium mustelinum]|uniref:Uncharacterized protein n=1 Tax=Gossypium mustelinum TaxID=34275 RepID=A0A5D2ZYL6_GOSMU|nr:hypothetical protein E1A91_A03G107700v1 [Gossypium mustelinum]
MKKFPSSAKSSIKANKKKNEKTTKANIAKTKQENESTQKTKAINEKITNNPQKNTQQRIPAKTFPFNVRKPSQPKRERETTLKNQHWRFKEPSPNFKAQ